MATRFELVLDDAGKFHFQLRGPDGDVLLRSVGCNGKIGAQTGVLHVRNAPSPAATASLAIAGELADRAGL